MNRSSFQYLYKSSHPPVLLFHRLVTAVEVSVDESSLTGEVEPTHKVAQAVVRPRATGTGEQTALNTADMQNIAFMGTMVCSGRATGLVVATGERTQFGQVFRMMSDEESPPTPLQVRPDLCTVEVKFQGVGDCRQKRPVH
jgi:Ca2+-transporting ATPase